MLDTAIADAEDHSWLLDIPELFSMEILTGVHRAYGYWVADLKNTDWDIK